MQENTLYEKDLYKNSKREYRNNNIISHIEGIIKLN